MTEHLKIDDVIPNPSQPRKVFEEHELQELEDSVKVKGVVQPITVRAPEPEKGLRQYQIIDGERRWRVSKRLGLESIPAIIDADIKTDRDAAVRSLIVNSQRADLPPLEKENAIFELFQELDRSVKQVSKASGYSEQTIKQYLKAQEFRLKLPSKIQRGTTKTALAETEFIKDEEIRIKILELIHDNMLAVEHGAIRGAVKLFTAVKEGTVRKGVPEAYFSGLFTMGQIEIELDHEEVMLRFPEVVSDRIPRELKEAVLYVWDNAWREAYLRSEDYKKTLDDYKNIAFNIQTKQWTNLADLPEPEQKKARESIEMQRAMDREETDDFLKYYDECKKLIETREAVEAKYGEQTRRDFGWWLSSPALEKTEHLELEPDLRIAVLDLYADYVYLEEIKKSIRSEEERWENKKERK